MRTHVEFKSKAFPAYPNEDGEVNPGRWGKKLAEYLKTNLENYGFHAKPIYAEDWGWAIPIANLRFSLFVGCGNYSEYENGFLVFISPDKPFIQKLFKKISTVEVVNKLSEAIDTILRNNKDIFELKWWSEEQL